MRRSLAVRPAMSIAAVVLLVIGTLGAPGPAIAADGLTLQARALVQGHVRAASWFAVAVDVANAGPTITGELRITGGADSRTRFGTPVELATGSRKQYLLYALPPSFGGNMTVELVTGGQVAAKAQVAIALHDATQLVVGVVAEDPAGLVGELDLLPNPNGLAPVIVPLATSDLPERIQAWAPLDRLVWQDVDAASLTPAQLAALRTWVSSGGRLVIVGGTAGVDTLTGFPDDLLPYRPTGLLDVDPSTLRPVLGGIPAGASTLAAYAGDATTGRTLATSGDRVIAADAASGSGAVTLLGFDPTTSWIANGEQWDAPLWRRLLPPRSGGAMSFADDSQIVSAVANLPSLALPATGALLVLLLGYIVLIGPVNYLVLRRVDRREWAWVTIPVLIATFTAGAYTVGFLVRGNDVILNEVAIVRGAQGTDQAVAQSWLGIFSPSRATFQLRLPGDALVAAPMTDVFGGASTGLDVLQGDPSRVRDLAVGYGSMRTIRAEASATGPAVEADLRLEQDHVRGTLTNRSQQTLVAPALVLGASSVTLGDIAPGASADVDLALVDNPMNQPPLSDRVVGSIPWDMATMSEGDQRNLVRRSIVEQLTYDPMMGFSMMLPGDAITLLAWGTDPVVGAEIEGSTVRRVANVLYHVPLPFTIRGQVTFRHDLLRSSTIEQDATFFSKDPWSIGIGVGEVRMSYRPLPFEGTFTAERIQLAMSGGGDLSMPGGNPTELRESPRCESGTEGCLQPQDGLPDVEILDVGTGAWVQFEHMAAGRPYVLPDPARWVSPSTGEVGVRFVNERQEGVYFQFPISLTGTVR
jgi:hypothetical protein